MEYIHVKNLDKYQPGYTDRRHIWAKIYYETFLDEAVQGLTEIDRYRFWSLIIFEVYTQKPVPLTSTNLKIMGWDKKKRAISLSLQMLHTLVEVRNVESKPVLRRVEESRVDKSRIEKNKYTTEFEIFWKKFTGRWDSDKDRYVKVGKYSAWEEWQHLKAEEKEKALAAADRVSGKFTPDACRWLKRKMFDDFGMR